MFRLTPLLFLLLAGCGEDLDPRAQGTWRVEVAAVSTSGGRPLSAPTREALRGHPNPLLTALAFEFGPRTFTVRTAHGVSSGRFSVEKRDGDTSVLVTKTKPPQRMQVTVVDGGLQLTYEDRTLPLVPAQETAP